MESLRILWDRDLKPGSSFTNVSRNNILGTIIRRKNHGFVGKCQLAQTPKGLQFITVSREMAVLKSVKFVCWGP